MKIKITKVRKQIFDYLVSYNKEFGYMPTVREIGAHIKQRNPSVVQYHLDKLKDAGLIEKETGYARSIVVTLNDEIVVIDNSHMKDYSKDKRRVVRVPVSKEAESVEYFNGCAYCGKPSGGTYHKDHFVPFILGGSDDKHNILLACSKCNLEKGAKDPVKWTIENYGIERLSKIILFLGTR